jgi:anthranilate phosphoribosyltransferase
VAGKAGSLADGAAMAAQAIDGKHALGVLDALVRVSNE